MLPDIDCRSYSYSYLSPRDVPLVGFLLADDTNTGEVGAQRGYDTLFLVRECGHVYPDTYLPQTHTRVL